MGLPEPPPPPLACLTPLDLYYKFPHQWWRAPKSELVVSCEGMPPAFWGGGSPKRWGMGGLVARVWPLVSKCSLGWKLFPLIAWAATVSPLIRVCDCAGGLSKWCGGVGRGSPVLVAKSVTCVPLLALVNAAGALWCPRAERLQIQTSPKSELSVTPPPPPTPQTSS